MEFLLTLFKALLTIQVVCAIFNLLIMLAPLTSQEVHEEIVEDMKKEYPDDHAPSRAEMLFVCVIFAPFMTHWILTDMFGRGQDGNDN